MSTIYFTTASLDGLLADQDGSLDWLFEAGGDLVDAFDDTGLLDEIQVAVRPLILGGGAPLLPRRIHPSRLDLQSVERLGQAATLAYRVKPRSST